MKLEVLPLKYQEDGNGSLRYPLCFSRNIVRFIRNAQCEGSATSPRNDPCPSVFFLVSALHKSSTRSSSIRSWRAFCAMRPTWTPAREVVQASAPSSSGR